MKNNKRRGVIYILIAPLLMTAGFASIFVGNNFPEESMWRSLFILAIGFPLLAVGFLNLIPSLIYGISIYTKKNNVNKLLGDSHGSVGIPVWIIQTRLARLLGGSILSKWLAKATEGTLTWSNSTHTLRLEHSGDAKAAGKQLQADYSEISTAAYTVNQLVLTIHKRKYILYIRSNVSDAAYVAGLTTAGTAGPSIAFDATAMKMGGIDELLDGLRFHGVDVIQPSIARAIEIGAVIASALFVIFWLTGTVIWAFN